jgi:tripartite ATP-independent transporter DctM subunit
MAWRAALMAFLMFAVVCLVLLLGYPVALSLGGVALWFAGIGIVTDLINPNELLAMPNRLFGIMGNDTLVAVPLFVLMGVVLEKAKLAEDLLESMAALFGGVRGGLGVSVILVGALLAASTGIVGATVVTMGLLSLPTMLKRGYSPSVASGTIAAAGTLGQIIPPSIVLVLLGDVLSSAYQQAQLAQGIFSIDTVSVGDLFMGALIPGLLLVLAYMVYILMLAWLKPTVMPAPDADELLRERGMVLVKRLLVGLLPPLSLMVAVLGTIMLGYATPTEAAAVGACGAMLLATLRGQLGWAEMVASGRKTAEITSMVFLILIGASLFSMVFNAYHGDEAVHRLLTSLPGGAFGAMLCVMLLMFLLGFILDFIEITFVIVPIVGPVLLQLGLDPVWLGVMLALNLQTSFLTPPFGFALFYLRGVAPPELSTQAIYRGVVPFILIQLAMLAMLALWPGLATWLPTKVYG